MTVVFRSQAAEEVLSAQRCYDNQKPGLGDRFEQALSETIRRIVSNPLVFAPVYGEIRRAIVRQFPFGIYFRIHQDDVIVLAVMHGRRHSPRWESRR